MLLEPIPEDIREEVMKEVGEYGNKMEENLQLVKQWMKCQPHLPHSTYDERILKIFLRGCKHNLSNVKNKLDNHFTARSVYPEIYDGWDPCSARFQQTFDLFQIVPLPKTSADGSRIIVHKFTSTDVSNYDVKLAFKSILMVSHIRLIEEPAITGDIFLFDVGKMTAAHAAKLATPMLKHILYSVQNGYPQRLKQIHLFNAPPLIDRVVTLFKQVLKEKMRNRFHIHVGHETLYKYVPRDLLPQDYGGDLKSLDDLSATWLKKLKSYKNYFDDMKTIRSDESKRVTKSNCFQDQNIFGQEGAFRKLNID